MSGTTTQTAQQASDKSLWSPQVVIAMTLLVIGAATVAGVFLKGDAATINVIAGVVIGAAITGPSSFYFGSSKGSQAKDATIAAAVPVQTTTTTGQTP